jgi:outer membrane lipopolysaccharide assembly protein LptE/RlpB
MRLKNSQLLCLLLLLVGLSGCGVYSFTGANISPDVKTASIQTFYNNSPLGPSNMSVLFTEKLKDYFTKNTSLTLVQDEGDLQFEGTIENYTLTPVAPQANNTSRLSYSALTRITISVKVSYTNTKDETFNYQSRNFSFYRDFDQNSTNLSSEEQAFVEEIFDQIVLDIFNSSVANW